ncbi:3'5'-cyclic nucleotide phosphodiesterase family protein [Trichomonas vaginalis G3]|uniref:3'5'-cyclic nucleotide phosphodiesterase family protein n=1 Tax=Trichomonas vaginalis (strain ATCC PRA-98 / G3) TaxID=412133 RepID=A2E8W5_TRIV3|nr:cyclic nucleotide phosphodiesterase family [Trichomonas vaginalis G3]EAY10947.1 3'5'-cyclic nucleotide phosphodiesterase family protein [Trichomonas vaginalis G3]KAI5485513.1 cyclic nucleotide phosphodiesterase family [Trichomonas vaginalis G3]|eukprot:XP_001323170.1 3'5'-cyclic nucleotide phosphodiesterase family protein [Trichomonas vaginalis G3]
MPPGFTGTKPLIPRLIRPYNRRHDAKMGTSTKVGGVPNKTTNIETKSYTRPKIAQPVSHLVKKQDVDAIINDQLVNEFDDFFIEAYSSSIVDATETFMNNKFEASNTLYFQDIPSIQQLFSPTYRISSTRTSGIVAYAYFTRSIIRTSKPTTHPSYHAPTDSFTIPQDCPVLIIPVWDYKDKVVGVVEIVKPFGSPDFTEEDEKWGQLFQYKFQVYSRFFLRAPANEPMLLDLLSLGTLDQIIPQICNRIQNYLGARNCEIWRIDLLSQKTFKYGFNILESTVEKSGIVGAALSEGAILNCPRTHLHPQYNPDIDGQYDEPLLFVPVTTNSPDEVYGVVLRGTVTGVIFTNEDENALCRVAPFITLAILNSHIYTDINTEFERSRAEREGLAALLEVAEILSGQLEIDRLTEVIMEKGRQLTKADRCSLFIVSQSRDRLITSFQRGLANSIDIPINKGIAGQTVTEKKVINIADAYSDPSFDNTTDMETGYRTRSILSVPIINNNTGEVIGVTEMVNKADMTPFTAWDAHLIQIFNVFCGISLENATLYRQSIDMTNQLRSFFDASMTLTTNGSLQKVLKDIVTNARKSVDARRAAVFLVDETTSTLSSFISDGGKLPATLPLAAGIVGACVKSKEIISVTDAYSDPRFNRSVDKQTGFKTTSLLAAPIISKSGEVLGVVEMVNKETGSFSEKDATMIKSFATFASVSLENARLKNIAELGSAEIEMAKYVGESERQSYDIPNRLVLSDDQKSTASSLNFLCTDCKGIGQVKILFYLFNKFKILERFSITNEMFFRFIYEVRSYYHDVPYHNWTHAVDVVEYVSYEITTAKLENVLTPLEIFALLLSAVCHDAGHDGFNNVYNEKSETPLGILFKSQSVMETHHCTVAIQILSNDETNLLHALNPTDIRKMWNMIIKLILATDMAHHFKMVKDTGALLDENTFDLKKDEHRMLAMQLLLKIGDISNVSRPFKLADKWCDILSEEFWRQGDNEIKNGLGLSSPLNDRNNQDKPKGQIGFYNFVCLPLYQVVARLFPPLEVNLNSVKANLEVWKSLAIQGQK